MYKKLKDKKIRIVKRQLVKDKDSFLQDVWIPIYKGTLWVYFRWLSGKEFHMKKSVVEKEITIANKLRFINITTDTNNRVGSLL